MKTFTTTLGIFRKPLGNQAFLKAFRPILDPKRRKTARVPEGTFGIQGYRGVFYVGCVEAASGGT
jgi:hypothetical protein